MDLVQEMNDSLRNRLRFVEIVIGWEGALGRKRVTDVFGITPNYVTKDLRVYKKLYPGNIVYNPSTRSYRPADGFTYKIASGDPDEYLALLRAGAEGSRNVVASLVGNPGICECLPQPKTPLDAATLRLVTRAIVAGSGLAITYQSLTSASPTSRDVWPHRLVFSGKRWYVRCWDGLRNEFRDFALSRITDVAEKATRSPKSPKDDVDWGEREVMRIVPNPKLSAMQANVIAREYGMMRMDGNWVWLPEVRRCLVRYVAERYRLIERGGPKAHPVILANKDDLRRWLFPEDGF